MVAPDLKRRRRLTVIGLAIGILFAAVVVLAVLSYGSLNAARSNLNDAKNVITADLGNKTLLTTPFGRDQLQQDIGTVSKDAAEAEQELDGSESLKVLGLLPVIDTQRSGLIQLALDVESAAATGATLLDSVNNLTATSHGTTVSLPALAALGASVDLGHQRLAALNRPASGLIGPIASARTAFDREDAKLVRLLRLSSDTIAFAAPFLGSEGPQQYLIGGENNAEMRDGGAVLSLDLLTADDGTFSVKGDATYGDYALTKPATVALPAGTQKIFGAYLPTEQWPDVDATADFPVTGESMQAMWAQATGDHVDGVLGIDVPGVASILRLTGPVTVPGITEQVSASNVADILLNKEYQGDSVNNPQNSRRDKIAAVVKAAVDKMKTEHVDLDAFANALAGDVLGRHLMVWSDVPRDESGLVTLDAAGTLTSSEPTRTIHLAVENSTADKLDYFVAVSTKLKVTVDRSGNALVNTVATVANFAAANQPPLTSTDPSRGEDVHPRSVRGRGCSFRDPRVPWCLRAPDESRPATRPEPLLPAARPGQLRLPSAPGSRPRHGQRAPAARLVPQARLRPDHLTVEMSAPGAGPSARSTHILDL